ncbi:MAG: mannitol-1-phosphate 5-dehydrogenase [Candidatus Hydrogenedentes bacterium]|nr:mannitol-1-phosphate 5-dehydrogenase [Candidatus Hydrogenedentota bacterium]
MNGQAVHFGAGNIGRGFIGQLYWESGFRTTFIDVNETVVRLLQERGSYPIHLVSETTEVIPVDNVTAIHGGDLEAVADALAEATIASTAVGSQILPRIAPAIAKGIEKRFAKPDATPLNIIICENLLKGDEVLREAVREHLAPEWHEALDTKVGFVEASIGRMVPRMTEAQLAEDPLLVCVEPYCELPLAGESFKGEMPPIKHAKPYTNFGAYVGRKLFVHNMSHAAAAYLGYLKGYTYIYEAIQDPELRPVVEGAMGESCTALARKHGLDKAELDAFAKDLIHRYQNKALADQVARVGGDLKRKLGASDRLIATAKMCLEQGVEPMSLVLVIAAALQFDEMSDVTAPEVIALIETKGVPGVLREVCGLEEGELLWRHILDAVGGE